MFLRVLRPFRGVDPARRRRIRIRAAVATASLVLLLMAGAWLARRYAILKLDRSWTEVEWAELPEVRTLQEYVRVDTSPETGSELAGARFLAERLQALGLEVHVEQLGERGANMWAILEGRRRVYGEEDWNTDWAYGSLIWVVQLEGDPQRALALRRKRLENARAIASRGTNQVGAPQPSTPEIDSSRSTSRNVASTRSIARWTGWSRSR